MENIPLCSGIYLDNGVIEYSLYLIFAFVTGNILIFIAYLTIPFLIVKLQKRPNIPVEVNNTLRYFKIFILLCGIGHFLKAFGVTHSLFNYFELGTIVFYIESTQDIITGLFSVFTTYKLFKYGIYFLELPTKEELKEKTDEVKKLEVTIVELNQKLSHALLNNRNN